MAFFTRPDLDDRAVRQETGSTLTLSGTTNFQGTLQSKGVEIDATTGGTGTTGYVMTFNGTKVALQENVAGLGNAPYNGQRAITQDVSNPSQAGNLGTTGITEFLDAYFFPDVPPDASISLDFGSTSRLFGDATDTSPSGDTINWSVTRNTNPITSINVNGQSFSPTTGITGTTGGTASYTATTAQYSPATGTTQTISTLTMTVQTATEVVNDSLNITWRHKRFWFKSNTRYFSGDDALIEGVLNTGTTLGNELSQTRIKTFTPITFSDEYFYYAFPTSFGVPAFTVNGLPNNAWGNSEDVPVTLFTFLYTNPNGYTEPYYLALSDNKLNNTFNISVS